MAGSLPAEEEIQAAEEEIQAAVVDTLAVEGNLVEEDIQLVVDTRVEVDKLVLLQNLAGDSLACQTAEVESPKRLVQGRVAAAANRNTLNILASM